LAKTQKSAAFSWLAFACQPAFPQPFISNLVFINFAKYFLPNRNFYGIYTLRGLFFFFLFFSLLCPSLSFPFIFVLFLASHAHV